MGGRIEVVGLKFRWFRITGFRITGFMLLKLLGRVQRIIKKQRDAMSKKL